MKKHHSGVTGPLQQLPECHYLSLDRVLYVEGEQIETGWRLHGGYGPQVGALLHILYSAVCSLRRDPLTWPTTFRSRRWRVTRLRTVKSKVRDHVVTGAKLSRALAKTPEGR